MAYDESLAQRILRFLAEKQVQHEAKRMMGGLCLIVNGKMCVGLVKYRLMVRVGPEAYDEALTRKGCRPMDFTGRPMRGFVFVEAEGLSSEKDLRHWLELALAFNPLAKKSAKARKATSKNKVRAFASAADDDPIRELGAQFGLGPKSAGWLHDAGVRTRADIAKLGPIEVCRRIMKAGHPVSVVVAYALAGGLAGYKWDALPPAEKVKLKRAFEVMKADFLKNNRKRANPHG